VTAVISDNAMRILKARYLTNGENVDAMFRRCSLGNERYYRLMSDLLFLPNSPTLFNCGLKNGCTLSACFVFDVEDTMFDHPDSIVAVRNKAIGVAKAGGGVGYYFGKLRQKNATIKSIHRKACGPVAVLRDYHGVRQLITQGGKRDLAQMGVLNCDHPDIMEFVHAKDEDPKALESFNLSVGWTNEWMSRIDFDGERGLNTANELWWEQCKSAWKTGCPGMFFPDIVNKFNFNKHLGRINAPNPCGETPNRSNEPCNLGSIPVSRFVNLKTRELDFAALYDTAYASTEFLDDILDANEFPHPDITTAARLTRKLGLGVMGWADTLALMGIHYDSPDALRLAKKVMGTIQTAADKASLEMGKKKGPYAGYSDKTEDNPYRNETRTSIAPTGTIALIAGVWGSIEPYFAFDVDRVTNEGMKLADGISDDVKKNLNGHVPKVANEVSLESHVAMQATFQKYVNLGVSKTINLPKTATVEDVSRAYKLMYQSGCKGGTIFRDGCRDEQVLRAKPKKSVYSSGVPADAEEALAGKRRRLPDRRQSETHKFNIAGTGGFLTVGMYDDGTPGEIFLRVSKIGSTMAGVLDTWAMTFSVALQYGTPLESLIRLHRGTRCEPCGMTKNKDIPVCSSIQDYVAQYLECRFMHKHQKPSENGRKHESAVMSGQFCPDCDCELVSQAGCLSCVKPGCGWTRCG
jgi:ribonucleoside-diphosphate reductase alpha chain